MNIKPYYQDEWVTIVCGDCRESLPRCDVVLITDPPYGINLDLSWLEGVNDKRLPSKNIDRIVGDDGSLDLTFLWRYQRRAIFGFPYIYDANATGWLVWDKQPGLMDTDRTITTPVEMASTTLWKGFRLVRCMWAGYMRDAGEYRYEHPTQKPQKVISYIIANYTNPNDLIYDPFLGSGTVAWCAKKLNRKCIGIEIEEKYCEISAKRCSQGVFELNV